MSTPSRSPVPWPAVVPAFALLALSACGGDSHSQTAANIVMDSTITSDQCVVTIAYGAAAVIDLADMTLDYTGASGSFGGPRYDARCRGLVRDATRSAAFNRCDSACGQGEHRELFLSFAMGEGNDDLVLDTPADLFECLFEGDGATLSELTGQIRLTGPSFSSYQAGPVEVRVECDGWPDASTTTSTTTSTLPCDGEPCEAGDVIALQLWLDDAITLGALQFNVDFSSLTGGFDQFSTPAARCRLTRGVNALFATNQVPRIDDPACVEVDCERSLIAGFAFGAGYTGPGQLMTCDFVVGREMPAPEGFSIRVVDASTPAGVPISPFPGVSLRGLPDR